MIERHFSADRVNEIVNDPSIYPWVCGPITGTLDLSKMIESDLCVALIGEHGGFVFFDMGHGIFDAHSIVLKTGRGKWAIRAARHALKFMFDNGATEIMMAAPSGNLGVLSLIRILKAKFRGSIEDGWWLNGKPVRSDIYSLTKTDYESCHS